MLIASVGNNMEDNNNNSDSSKGGRILNISIELSGVIQIITLVLSIWSTFNFGPTGPKGSNFTVS